MSSRRYLIGVTATLVALGVYVCLSAIQAPAPPA
jgi:hypothetical protein